ncbi:hypothetical protein [Sphingomonas aurea]|uniref:hypothetical protein n=1 Tax=Sphingomonas aurea TaxID=3063994 RepID=UPI00273221BA|nr:hypothetical protein [Sphingomonas sp. KR1UV-12]
MRADPDGDAPAIIRESTNAYAERRAVEIADKVVPAYRAKGARYSCTGQVARCWQTAYDGALAVLPPPASMLFGIHVVENSDGAFVASFATKMLADFFVDEGGGCYRHRACPADTPRAPRVGATERIVCDDITCDGDPCTATSPTLPAIPAPAGGIAEGGR